MTALAILNFAGGIGLFLLGMKLMSDGLRVAAGSALRSILARWTTSFPRAATSGFLITAMMQSSTAVIFATIGFVNAGFLNLTQAVSVIIGSAAGTTVTSWLVVVVGFDMDIKALAMPLIAIGMFLRILTPGGRRGPLGEALAGLGLFFLGLDLLREMFGDIDSPLLTTQQEAGGYLSLLPFLAGGFFMTLITQSSSAAIAVTLTAVGGGVIPLTGGAAVVIGANIGTTSTSLFASLGATPNARRAAVGHVVFNLTTGVGAFVALPLVMTVVALLVPGPEPASNPALSLAVFHTLIQISGLLLFWPFIPRLILALEHRFRTQEEDQSRPRYLDSTAAGVPSLAVEALYHELQRVHGRARASVQHTLSTEDASLRTIDNDRHVITNLTLAVGQFIREAQKADLPDEIAQSLPAGLRVTQYCTEMVEMAREILLLQPQLESLQDEALQSQLNRFRSEAVKVLEATDSLRDDHKPEHYEQAMQVLQEQYQHLKAAILRAGSEGKLAITQMALRLEEISHLRRALEQAVKAAHYLTSLLQPVKDDIAYREANSAPEDNASQSE